MSVQQPGVAAAVSAVTGRAVVVPLLLSTGVHTAIDIPRAAGEAGGDVVVTAPLGPHRALVEILEDRLLAAGSHAQTDEVVLAGSGSRDPQSASAVRSVARSLATRGWRVRCGAVAGAGPSVDEVVELARAQRPRRVVVASYVLAPGHFARAMARSDADVVTEPLAPDPRIAGIVIERYLAAASG